MTTRIALALLFVVPAVMAYPWDSNIERWILGVAVAVVVVVFAWWRGLFATTMVRRLFGVWRRNHATPKPRSTPGVTVMVRVDDSAGVGLPLRAVAGYVQRFGVRCEKVRVTTHHDDGVNTTWISLTVDAVHNLAALRARSADLPLRDTAEIVGRRLADHLRETGLSAVMVSDTDAPLVGTACERWSGVQDDRGVLSAYVVPVDNRLDARLVDVWSQSTESWTAIEFTGAATRPDAAVLCAFRTAEPARSAPLAGLICVPGLQRPLITALGPASVQRFDVPTSPVSPELLQRIDWPVGGALLSRT